MLGIVKSLRSLGKNPSQPQTEAPPEFIAGLEAYLLRLGASSVGYTRVPGHWVFQTIHIEETGTDHQIPESGGESPGHLSCPRHVEFGVLIE